MRLRPINPVVSADSGQQSTSTSLAPTSSSSSMNATPSGRPVLLRLLTSTSRSNALAIAATFRPTAPKPTMPMVRPARSLPWSACSRPASQPCSRRSRSTVRNFRRSAIDAKKTCSATVPALTPGTLATSTPALVAASTGIMSRPAPWRIAARSRAARSNRAAGIGARTMTMSAGCRFRGQGFGVERRGHREPGMAGEHGGRPRMQRMRGKDQRHQVRSRCLCGCAASPWIRSFQ